VALRTWPVIPVLCLLRPAARGLLPGYADQVLGFDAVLCLAACLAVTPVMTIARAPAAKLRWWYGNWVFVLGSAGLAVHLACPPGSMGDRAASDLVKWTGTAVIVLLLPMAVTSSAVAQKLLGPEWKRWQRAGVWAVWAVVVVHLALLHAWLATGAYLAVTLPAVIVRHPRARKSIKEWRAGGYSTGGWWAAVAVLGLVALTGLSALTGQEALAVARAVTLAP
jgi:DMSO/TMAO reductase YedYZ heme-binding membrane subunit